MATVAPSAPLLREPSLRVGNVFRRDACLRLSYSIESDRLPTRLPEAIR
jgi:hypothetical protein